jgi:hypothetical protein
LKVMGERGRLVAFAGWVRLCQCISGSLARIRAAGNVAVKHAPFDGALSMVSVASWRCSTCLTMESPNPVPPLARERSESTR